MNANNKQIDGNHYKNKAIQPWDYITSNNLGYLEGNIVKYVSRWKDKGGYADLKKAQHYLEKLLEIEGMKPKKEEYALPTIVPPGYFGPTVAGGIDLAEQAYSNKYYYGQPGLDLPNDVLADLTGMKHSNPLATDKPTTKKYLNVKNQDNQGN
jgi:hypothetical protein